MDIYILLSSCRKIRVALQRIAGCCGLLWWLGAAGPAGVGTGRDGCGMG